MAKGLLDRLAEGIVLGDGGYLLELEKRGYVRGGPFTPGGQHRAPRSPARAAPRVRAGRRRGAAGADVLRKRGQAGDGGPRRTGSTTSTGPRSPWPGRPPSGATRSSPAISSLTWAYDPNDAASADHVRALFDRQLEVQMDVGIDLVIGETFTWLGEALIAAERAKRTGLPVVVTMSFEKDPHAYEGRTAGECATQAGRRRRRRGRHELPAQPRAHAPARATRWSTRCPGCPSPSQPVAYRTPAQPPDFTSLAGVPLRPGPAAADPCGRWPTTPSPGARSGVGSSARAAARSPRTSGRWRGRWADCPERTTARMAGGLRTGRCRRSSTTVTTPSRTRFKHDLALHERQRDLRVADRPGVGREEVAVDHREVRELPGRDRAGQWSRWLTNAEPAVNAVSASVSEIRCSGRNGSRVARLGVDAG